jgi:phosphate transport system ATP-binding protein
VEPQVLLCDEPTSALDPISSRHIEEQLSALRKDYTIVLVTHTLRQARRLANYVLFVYFGNLIEHGSAEQVFTNPVDPRTKAYIEGVFG